MTGAIIATGIIGLCVMLAIWTLIEATAPYGEETDAGLHLEDEQ